MAGVTCAQQASYKNPDTRMSGETWVVYGMKCSVLMDMRSKRMSRGWPIEARAPRACLPPAGPLLVQRHHQLMWLDVTIFRGGGYPMERAATLPRSHEVVVKKREEGISLKRLQEHRAPVFAPCVLGRSYVTLIHSSHHQNSPWGGDRWEQAAE